MSVAMSCVTTALQHEDIIPNISPLFASIPELCTPEALPSAIVPCQVASAPAADPNNSHSVDSGRAANLNHLIQLIDSGHAANAISPIPPILTMQLVWATQLV